MEWHPGCKTISIVWNPDVLQITKQVKVCDSRVYVALLYCHISELGYFILYNFFHTQKKCYQTNFMEKMIQWKQIEWHLLLFLKVDQNPWKIIKYWNVITDVMETKLCVCKQHKLQHIFGLIRTHLKSFCGWLKRALESL